MLYWTPKMEHLFKRAIEALTNSDEVSTLNELRIAQLRRAKRDAITAHAKLMGMVTYAIQSEEDRILSEPNVSLTCMLSSAGVHLEEHDDEQG